MAAQGMTRDVLLQIISQFEDKGVEKAKKSILDLSKLDKKTFLGGLTGVFKGMVSDVLGLLNPLKMVQGLVGTLASGVNHLGGIFKIALGVVAGTAINTVASALKELITSPVEIAARVGALEVVFYRLGQQAGYAKDALVGYVDALKDTGITTRQSLENLTRMIQANLDLSRATDLARVAQNAAVIAGVNSSEAFSRLLHGITTLQPEVLRGLGIVVDMQSEIKRWAEANDVATTAISATTKQQIAFDAVLAAGQRIAGAYEEAMTEVGKKMTSLPRYIEEAKLALGRGLKPVLSTTVDILGDLLKKAKAFFEEIEPTLTAFSERVGVGLTALYEKGQRAVAALIEGFSRVRPYLQELGEIIGHYLPQVVSRLKLLWIELKNALSGLATAASTYLPGMTSAWTLFTDTVKASLDSVLKILDGFRLLLKGQGEMAAKNFTEAMANGLALLIILWEDYVSQAVTWGFNLVAQFAQGMMDAAGQWVTAAVDYVGGLISQFLAAFSPPQRGILHGITEWGKGLINEYFQGFLLADFGILDRVGSAIYNALQSAVSLGDLPEKELIPTFRKVRELVAGLISDFRKTGQIGEEALGKISETLGEGSEDLVKYLRLQLEHQKAMDDLGKVAEEYAEAEAAGFIPAELKERLRQAQEAADAKADELSWQEALIKAQQDGVDLQVKQLQVLQKLAKVLDKMTAAKVPKAKKEEPTLEPDTFTPLPLGVDTDRLKADIDAGIAGAFAGVSERFEQAKKYGKELIAWLIEGAQETLADLPGTIREGLTSAWDALRERFPIIDEFIAKVGQIATQAQTFFAPAFDSLKTGLQGFVQELAPSLPYLKMLFDALVDLGPVALQLAGIIGTGLLVALRGMMDAFGSSLPYIGQLITGVVVIVTSVLTGLAHFIEGVFLRIKGIIIGDTEMARRGAELAITGLVEVVVGLLVGLYHSVSGLVQSIYHGIVGGFQSLYDAIVGESIIPDLVNGIIGWFQTLYDSTLGKIGELVVGVVSKLGEIKDKVAGGLGALGSLFGLGGEAADLGGIEAGVARLQELITAVSEQWNALLLRLVGEGGIIPQIKMGAIEQFTLMGQEVVRLTTDMESRVIYLIVSLKTRSIQLITALVVRAIQLFTQMKSKVVALVVEMVQEILEALAELRDKSEEILEETVAIFERMAERMAEALWDIRYQIQQILAELQKMIDKANEAKDAWDDLPFSPGSPPPLAVGLQAVIKEMRNLDRVMGNLVRVPSHFEMQRAFNMSHLQAAGPGGGNTYQFIFTEGAFSGAFPGVRTARDAGGVMDEFQRIIEGATAKANIPGGVK